MILALIGLTKLFSLTLEFVIYTGTSFIIVNEIYNLSHLTSWNLKIDKDLSILKIALCIATVILYAK